jgi:hypothetical protein
MNETLHPTLFDTIALLRQERLPYALIGGLAVSFRGKPRVTGDVDVVVSAELYQILALAGRLNETGFVPLFEGVEEVIEKSFILPLRHRKSKIVVDIAVGLSGFERQVVQRAESLQFAGRTLSVATAEDLLLLKVLAGRTKDEQDLHGLVIANGSRIDWDYCLLTAAELGEAIGQDLVSKINALRNQEGFE